MLQPKENKKKTYEDKGHVEVDEPLDDPIAEKLGGRSECSCGLLPLHWYCETVNVKQTNQGTCTAAGCVALQSGMECLQAVVQVCLTGLALKKVTLLGVPDSILSGCKQGLLGRLRTARV